MNWAFLTPSVASLLEPRDVPSLRTLLLGGEAPTQRNIDTWAGHVSLHLVTGPAECAVYCAASDAIQPGCRNPSTVGAPAGCRMWVVEPSDWTQLVPVGCPGELVIEGRIVARGYVKDAERTKDVFLEEAPWLPVEDLDTAALAPRKLFKTGDLVRPDVDSGTFSFVARKDSQVKVYGQRVELGEIECQLKTALAHVGVDSAITLLNDSAGENNKHKLVTFLSFLAESDAVSITQEGASLVWTQLGTDTLRRARNHLANVLPAYMIPTLFVPLREIPLTANGKRDLAKLRQIVETFSHQDLQAFSLSSSTATRPFSTQEKKLCALWAEVLNLDPTDLAPDSDFIRQGGDSFAAMRLVSVVARNGLSLTVSAILQNSQLSTMALVLSKDAVQNPTPESFSLLPNTVGLAHLKSHCATVCKVNVDQIEDVYPSTPFQEMLLTSSLSGQGSYVSHMTFQLPPPLLLYTFLEAWNQVVHSAQIFRTRFVSDARLGLLQVVVKEAIDWQFYESMDTFSTEDENVSMGHGTSLARFAIIRDGDEPAVFALTCHHVLYDAFTFSMVFNRVAEMCTAVRKPFCALY